MAPSNATVNFVNLTPHPINLLGYGIIQPSGTIARCEAIRSNIGNVNGVPVFVASYGPVVGLPEPAPRTVLIVSSLVRSARSDRTDIASPADFERDQIGNIIGCRALDVNESS